MGSSGGPVVKNLPATQETGSIPGSGRSPGGGLGNPLQYSRLENPTGRGAWRAAVHMVTESDTTERLNSSIVPVSSERAATRPQSHREQLEATPLPRARRADWLD